MAAKPNAECSKCRKREHIDTAHFGRKHRACIDERTISQRLSLEAQKAKRDEMTGVWRAIV